MVPTPVISLLLYIICAHYWFKGDEIECLSASISSLSELILIQPYVFVLLVGGVHHL